MCMGLFDATLYRWTEVYADFSTGNLCLTVAAPLFDESGTVLLGVSYSSQICVSYALVRWSLLTNTWIAFLQSLPVWLKTTVQHM